MTFRERLDREVAYSRSPIRSGLINPVSMVFNALRIVVYEWRGIRYRINGDASVDRLEGQPK